jgi:tetratricopeptide (TPR) repeat protein
MLSRFLLSTAFVVATALAVCAQPTRTPQAGAQSGWVSVRTRHFQVLGEAGEEEVRRAAARLELYRGAFVRLLPPEHFDRGRQTVVILFRDEESYEPFKPFRGGRAAAGVAGYFQPGKEADYITTTLEAGRDDSTLLHEYAHLLFNNHLGRAPLWLKEGLAEYYGTARLARDRRRLTLGAPAVRRARVLKSRALLPLGELLAAGPDSPLYLDPDRRSIFYAQAWVTVHYLLHGGRESGQTRSGNEFARFLELLTAGRTAAEALHGAFGQTEAEVEHGLRTYIATGRFRGREVPLGEAVVSEREIEVSHVAPALLQTFFGDLLMQVGRLEEADHRLTQAQALDAALPAVNLRLGALRLRQGRFTEAVALLRQAAAAAPEDPYALYYLAQALDQEGLGMSADDLSVKGFEEKTELVRGLLRRAIEVAPRFVEAYRLLALVEIERGGRPAEAAALVERAMSFAPRREDLPLVLAHARLSAKEFNEARRLAERAAHGSADPLLRQQARTILERVETWERKAAELRASEEEAARRAAEAVGPTQPCDMPEPGPYHKRLRFKGEQACGRLVEIECGESSLVFVVEADGRTLRLRADSFSRVRFVSYTAEVRGHLTCGPRTPVNTVLITYRPRRPDSSDAGDGEALAVEFIPPDWNR